MVAPPDIETLLSSFPSLTAGYWFLAPVITLALFAADISLTYLNTKGLEARYGLPLAASVELNKTIRKSWLKHGLKKGYIIAEVKLLPIGLLMLGFMTFVWYVFPIGFGLALGLYSFILALHWNARQHLDSYHPCPQCRRLHAPSPYTPQGQ